MQAKEVEVDPAEVESSIEASAVQEHCHKIGEDSRSKEWQIFLRTWYTVNKVAFAMGWDPCTLDEALEHHRVCRAHHALAAEVLEKLAAIHAKAPPKSQFH